MVEDNKPRPNHISEGNGEIIGWTAGKGLKFDKRIVFPIDWDLI